MDLHSYTRELLEKHLLPELKEIAQGLGIVPDGNKTRRETWVAALVGKSFPVFQTLEIPLDADRAQEPIEPIEDPPVADRAQEPVEKPLDVDRAQEPIENSPGVDRTEELIEVSDLASALAEIARLRALNEELLERARSQSETIRRAKDISPVEKPSLKRVLALARAACLDVAKSAEGAWVLSMAHLKRSFKKLRDIWDLLIVDDWFLEDLFSPPLPVVKNRFSQLRHTPDIVPSPSATTD